MDKDGVVSKNEKGKKYLEKEFNLDMALRLERMLKQAGANVIMTRRDDTYSYLYYRSAFVNNYIMTQEHKKQSEQLKSLQKKKKTEDTNLKSKQDAKSKEEDKLRGYIEKLESKKAELNKLNNESENLLALYEELDALQNQLDQLQKNYNKQFSGIEDQITALNEEIKAISDQIKEEEDDAKKEELEDQLEKLKSDLDGIQKPLDDLTKKIEELNQQISDKEDEISKHDQKDIQSKINTLEDEIKKLNKSIGTAQEKINKLTNEISSLKDTINALGEEIELKEALVKELKDLLGKLEYHLKRPANKDREGLYIPSKWSGNRKTVGHDQKKILDLTREGGYDEHMIFVAVHCNASGTGNGSASGVQVYYMPNGPNTKYGSNYDYYRGYNDAKRKKLAESMLKNVRENTNFKKQWSSPFIGDYHVLREQNLPSVLMEIGFVDNPDDVKLLVQPQTRENAAKGMYLGIVEYFKSK
ncbi:MAG: N-acetylmuramoyl-L-alanine amidase [Caldicoprobacterales bacterium]